MITYALKRRAIQIWGNTNHARKWLRAIEYLGPNWVMLQPVQSKSSKTVKLITIADQVQAAAAKTKRRKI